MINLNTGSFSSSLENAQSMLRRHGTGKVRGLREGTKPPLHFGVGAAILAEPRNLTQPLKPKDLTDKMYVFLKTSKARLGRATNGWFSFFFYFSSGAQGLAHAIPVIS